MSFGQSSPSHETHLLNNRLFSLFLVFVFFRFLFASWSDLHTYTQTHTCSNTLSLTHTYTHTPSQTPIFISLQCSSLSLTQNTSLFFSLLFSSLTISYNRSGFLSFAFIYLFPHFPNGYKSRFLSTKRVPWKAFIVFYFYMKVCLSKNWVQFFLQKENWSFKIVKKMWWNLIGIARNCKPPFFISIILF